MMRMFLASDHTITLGHLMTISRLNGRKRMGECTVKLDSNTISVLRNSYIPEGSSGPVRSRIPSKKENGEQVVNELQVQFTNIFSPSAKEQDDRMKDKLHVKILGDILIDFYAIFGDDMRLTVEVKKVTVNRDSRIAHPHDEDSVDQQAPSTVHNPVHALKSKIPARPSCQLNSRLPKPLQQQRRQNQHVQVDANVTTPDSQTSNTMECAAKGMRLVFERGIAAHFTEEIKFPKNWLRHWQDDDQQAWRFTAEVNIILTVETPKITTAEKCEDASELNRRILEQQIGTDVQIICRNKSVVKCHKAFLIAQSNVFKGLVASSKKDAEGVVPICMDNVNEDVVQEMLAFLYYHGMNAANECSVTAVELLKIGHSYGIRNLEVDMKNILLSKTKHWFTMNAALDMFLFAVKITSGIHDDLKKKALWAMKSKPDEFTSPARIGRLFDGDLFAVQQLFKELALDN